MKSNNYIKNISGYFFILCLIFSIASCDDDANDWSTDSSYDKLFRPLKFEQGTLRSNSVEIKYSKIVGAAKYEFELSEDSLQFTNIIRTIEVTSDTLKPSSSSSNVTRIEFKMILDDLNGSKRQSVRMRGVSADGNTFSDYVQLTFVTPDENIFLKNSDVSDDAITIKWTQTNRVTHLDVIEDATGEYILDKYELSAEDISSAQKAVSGLKVGSYYTFIIYNIEGDEVNVRGRMSVKTNGTAGSETYNVLEGDNLPSILQELLAGGFSNVTLMFENGKTYDLGSFSIPAGMISLTFSAPSGEMPVLNLSKVNVAATMDAINFEYVKVLGEGPSVARFIDTKMSIGEVNFSNVYISDYNCIVRVQNGDVEVGKVTMRNTWVNNTGGYGVFNVGSGTSKLLNLEVSECTFTEISTQLTDIRTVTESIIIRNCTFYNDAIQCKQIFRFDANNIPLSLVVEKCLFSGRNGDLKVESASIASSTLGLTFAGSYRTSEFQEGSKKFESITEYKGTAYDLFTDPDGRDFSIKENAGFAGENEVGDPRWFKE